MSGEHNTGFAYLRESEPQYSLRCPVLIAGKAGTGKSKLIEQMGSLFNLKKNQMIDIGSILRDLDEKRTGVAAVGYMPREPDIDKDLDGRIKKRIIQNGPFLLDAHLAALNVYELRMERVNIPPLITVLLRCSNEQERLMRVWRRDQKKIANLTENQSNQIQKERAIADRAQWSQTHPLLIQYPSLDIEDPPEDWFRLLYSFDVDTSRKSVDSVQTELLRKLIAHGAVSVKY